jgi:hypothetical protein
MSKPVFGLLAGLAVLAAAPVVLRRAGSRAIYGMGPDTAGRTLRLGFGEPRSHAGEALNDYRWHPQRALAQLAGLSKGRKGKGSRSFGMDRDERHADDRRVDAAERHHRITRHGKYVGTATTDEVDAANAEYRAALQARNQNDRKRRARESGSRAVGAKVCYVAIVAGSPVALPASVSHDFELSRQYARKTLNTEHVELGRAGGSRAVGVDAHNPKSRAEYIAYLDDLAQRARDGKLTFDEDSRWSYRAGVSPYDHHTTARKLLTEAILRNVATEREWISTWPDRNPGTDRGSRAFTLDDPSRGQF